MRKASFVRLTPEQRVQLTSVHTVQVIQQDNYANRQLRHIVPQLRNLLIL